MSLGRQRQQGTVAESWGLESKVSAPSWAAEHDLTCPPSDTAPKPLLTCHCLETPSSVFSPLLPHFQSLLSVPSSIPWPLLFDIPLLLSPLPLNRLLLALHKSW